MIEIAATNLSFVKPTARMPTIELDTDSIPETFSGYSGIVESVLKSLATKNRSAKATVYVYEVQSVNFAAYTWSAFFGVAGAQNILNLLLSSFQNIPGVRAKFSDFMSPIDAIMQFHIQDGMVWCPLDAITWYANEDTTPTDEEGENMMMPAKDDVVNNSELSQEVATPNSRNAVPLRYKAANANASIGTIKKKIEEMLNLPEGSVALCGPDGKPLRSDAKIATLRKRWES